MRSNGEDTIAFMGSSLVCSLGVDVVGACAAARAGIVRPTTIDTFVVGTRDDFGGVTVYAAPGITHGFEGGARLLRLLQAALEDLQCQLPDAPWTTAQTGFYISLPHPDRQYMGVELISDDELRKQEKSRWEEVQANRPEPLNVEKQARKLIDKAARLARWNGPVDLRAYSVNGNTGVAELIRIASSHLQKGEIELAIVGGVDSWVDSTSLHWLERRARLKCITMPVGLMPGEAGGFLVLEKVSRAQSHEAKIGAVLGACELDFEKDALIEAKISQGEVLTRMLRSVLSSSKRSSEDSLWFITDQNGEEYRAQEWGWTLTRMTNEHSWTQEPIVWYPAVSFGDTGAALGVVQVSMALQSFNRDYASSNEVILTAGADAGHRSVTTLYASV